MKTGVVGKSTTFQKIGTGTATTKARHGVITPMNQGHTPYECNLFDFYAGDYVDRLDEAKTNIDERMAIAQGGAWALGRKVDDQIITSLGTTTQGAVTWVVTSANAIRNSMINMAKALFANDVPNDGNAFGLLTPQAWAFAMTINQFTSKDYVTNQPFEDGPPVAPVNPGISNAIDFMNVKWMMHPGLTGVGTATASVFAYHKFALGYATGAHAQNNADNDVVRAMINYIPDRDSYFVNHAMSGGAILIDDKGVIKGTVDDTASLPTT